ncbi:pyridoxamine 5'-phosphate oxidase family protein [bacterium]|nr:pyridoxamine 5'-phosphate oxidase family protein [bacterium]
MRRLDPKLRRFFDDHQVLTLAVKDPDGEPHAAAVFYAPDPRLALYFLSDPLTRHGQALAGNGIVAGTIQRDRPSWRRIRGVQLRGRCRLLSGTERERGWEVYCRRFGFLRQPSAILVRALRPMVLWKLEPEWVRLIDNRAGFGRKREWGGSGAR